MRPVLYARTHRLMTIEQAITELRTIRYAKPPTLRGIAKAAGVHRETLYRAIRTGRLPPSLSQSVIAALQDAAKQRDHNRRSAPL